ncbi:hypothetical protein Z043_100437, partial [Scleropages formosus]
NDGRTGMAAIVLKKGHEFDSVDTYKIVTSYLPSYARPRFLRIQNSFAVTETYKQIKIKLVEEGFDPSVIRDLLYFLDNNKKNYSPLGEDIYNSIRHGIIRL